MENESPYRSDPRRLVPVALFLTFALTAVVGQLVRFQVFRHEELRSIAEQQLSQVRDLPIRRGTITDRNDTILALDIVQWEIAASPTLIVGAKKVAAELSRLLNLPEDELLAKLEDEDQVSVPIAQGVSQQIGEAIDRLNESGLVCIPHPRRVYPAGDLTSHLLGIVTIGGDGFYGVEGYYNGVLTQVASQRRVDLGRAGRDASAEGQTDRPLINSGTSLVLTLDLNIQYIVEEELRRALQEYGAKQGTIIVMDPRSGAILASASFPSYDPNDFVHEDLDRMDDPAVAKMWEPGSIFKIITWAGALDAGTITPNTQFDDEGALEVGGRVIRNWDRTAHGVVDVEEGLVQSLNTVAASISTGMGKDRFYTYLRRFGFGSLTEVDLSSEGPGMMKLPGDSDWFPSELGTNSFGQGIAVTPLQMITAVAAVANQGQLMKPHIVSKYVVYDETGQMASATAVQPTLVRRAISPEAARTLTDMLITVVERGTLKARIPGYRIAGKSGTAQIPTAYGYEPTDTIASFVGYAPADNPEFIILVKLDRPQTSPWGNHTAAPTFRAIAERLLLYLKIPPDAIRLAGR